MRTRPEAFPLVSIGFFRGFLVTMRPYLLFVSGITGLAGLALAPRLPLGSTLMLGIVFFLSYGFGQALTDCFQLDTDSLSAPYRPLVRGSIRRRDVLIVSALGLVGVGAVLISFHAWNLPLVVLSIAGLATYTSFKRRWWAGPFYNAVIVALLLLIGYASGTAGPQAPSWTAWLASTHLDPIPAALPGALILVFFGYANFVLTGYFKDISADRAAAYRTLPVVYGTRLSAWISDGFALLALLGAGVATLGAPLGHAGTGSPIAAFLFLASGTMATLVGQVRIHRVRLESDAHRAIEPVVHAYILLLAGVAVLHKPSWTLALAVFYAAYALAMRVRPERAQI
jgi:4-hydroxybenzoate polyprenyltransferase